MTSTGKTSGEGPATAALEKIRAQAQGYLEARYGDAVWFRAPETFGPFEHWVWAVASSEDEAAARVMGEIEQHFKSERG
jgi:hypothetical protein